MRKTRTEQDYVRVDEKHHLDVIDAETLQSVPRTKAIPVIVKTGNHTVMPDNEPRILFRGRDRLALGMLRHYRELCIRDGCTDYQLTGVDYMIREFEEFAAVSTTMKQPGITLGK